MEAGLLQPPGKLFQIAHAKLDLGLHGYHAREYKVCEHK